MRSFLIFLCAAAVLAVSGCISGKPKSSARIYEGDAPTIQYHSKGEAAGGRLGGQ